MLGVFMYSLRGRIYMQARSMNTDCLNRPVDKVQQATMQEAIRSIVQMARQIPEQTRRVSSSDSRDGLDSQISDAMSDSTIYSPWTSCFAHLIFDAFRMKTLSVPKCTNFDKALRKMLFEDDSIESQHLRRHDDIDQRKKCLFQEALMICRIWNGRSVTHMTDRVCVVVQPVQGVSIGCNRLHVHDFGCLYIRRL